MLCFVIALEFQSISISLSLCLTLTLSLPLSLYSFSSGHNTDCDSGIFLGYALFGYCVLLLVFAALFVLLLFIRDHNTDCIFVVNCIVCLYCVSLLFIRTTILTLINHGIFVLVFALIVCIVCCFSRSG